MARIKQNISMDEKIEKARKSVEKTKEKYDTAVKELRSLMEKKEAMKKKEMIKAIESSRRPYEEILDFLMTDGESE